MWYKKFGVRIFEGYGTTETAPVLEVNTPIFYKENTVQREEAIKIFGLTKHYTLEVTWRHASGSFSDE